MTILVRITDKRDRGVDGDKAIEVQHQVSPNVTNIERYTIEEAETLSRALNLAVMGLLLGGNEDS